jgi:hypothetical protein
VAEPIEPRASLKPEARFDQTDASKMIPVTAEDVARRRSRIVFVILTVVIAIGAFGGWIYKHSADPLRAQESYDDG